MSLEEELRIALRDRALEPAPQPDLLAGVRAGVRRDVRRRAALAGGASALALAAIAGVPFALSERASPAPIPAPAVETPAIDWVWPQWPAPAFPREPGWVPGGLGEPAVTVMGPNTHLQYERGAEILAAEVGPLVPDWEVEATEEHSASINGRQATVRTADDYDGARPGHLFVGVRWRADDGEWVQVTSFGTRSEAEVLRFARGLGAGSVPAGPASVTFARVPSGLVLQHQSGDGPTCLAAPGVVAAQRQPAGLCVGVTEDPLDDPGAERVVVGGRPASFHPDAALLSIDQGGGRALEMNWDPEEIPLTRDEAILLLAGVEVRR